MYEDLVKRLKSSAWWYEYGMIIMPSICLEAADAIEGLLKAAKAMHTWIFLNSGDEQAAYDECGLSDEMNVALGYGGQFVVETPRGRKLMYDELLKRLREVEEMLKVAQFKEAANLIERAADAIEELSAKATPKRVGFDGWKGCRNTRYKCPYCKKNVRNDETYCHKCGQALMFPRISHTPYVPGEKQDVIVTWPDEPPKEEA